MSTPRRTCRVTAAGSLHPLVAEARGYRRSFDTIVIDVPRFPAATAAAWERRIRRWYFACGCETGAVAVVAGTAAAGLWLLLTPVHITPSLTAKLAGLVLLAAVVGKALGLWVARRRLAACLADLQLAMSRPDLLDS